MVVITLLSKDLGTTGHQERCSKDQARTIPFSWSFHRVYIITNSLWMEKLDIFQNFHSVADETGVVFNLLDVNDNVPENLESVAEFEAPPSPDSSYAQALLGDEDFAKEPVSVPPKLHLTVLGSENSEEAPSSPKLQHVVLNHLFIEKGWASQSVVALGLTHRFQSKYVTVVLYKPLKR
ncbi:hypothetical protein RDI58_027951 [Solanum bulbocastanum]|uniref:Association with the SNF1 complex (ASC) domain-containing protein n=1 Tax=Solanum bulbocastanum TaxID=147425 RepID=A0AAN8SPK0_SOLBU